MPSKSQTLTRTTAGLLGLCTVIACSDDPTGTDFGAASGGGASGGGPVGGVGGAWGGAASGGGGAWGGAASGGGGAWGGAASGGGDSGGTLAAGGGVPSGGVTNTGGGGGSGGAASAGGGGSGAVGQAIVGLSWPIDCVPNDTCVNLGAPDIDDDGVAYDCGSPGYQGHQGTDIGITWQQMDSGIVVRAAADGEVFFAKDGKFDRCPDEAEPDCQNPPSFEPGAQDGTTVCTELGPYCGTGTGSCFWCFAGGNVIVLLHEDVPGVFATRYDHLKNGSILVEPGDQVTRGQVIAQVGSAGNSTGPHLHFEVWGSGYYELAEPWAGPCGPNLGPSLWGSDPPWAP